MIRALLSTLAALAVLGLGSAYAHDTTVKLCFAEGKRVTKIGENVLPNGLLMEQYDTNANGKPDVVTLSQVTMIKMFDGSVNIVHDSHPTFYLFNKDEDESTDSIYIDIAGKGNCSDIVLYHDYYAPQTPNAPNMETSKEAAL